MLRRSREDQGKNFKCLFGKAHGTAKLRPKLSGVSRLGAVEQQITGRRTKDEGSCREGGRWRVHVFKLAGEKKVKRSMTTDFASLSSVGDAGVTEYAKERRREGH